MEGQLTIGRKEDTKYNIIEHSSILAEHDLKLNLTQAISIYTIYIHYILSLQENAPIAAFTNWDGNILDARWFFFFLTIVVFSSMAGEKITAATSFPTSSILWQIHPL